MQIWSCIIHAYSSIVQMMTPIIMDYVFMRVCDGSGKCGWLGNSWKRHRKWWSEQKHGDGEKRTKRTDIYIVYNRLLYIIDIPIRHSEKETKHILCWILFTVMNFVNCFHFDWIGWVEWQQVCCYYCHFNNCTIRHCAGLALLSSVKFIFDNMN